MCNPQEWESLKHRFETALDEGQLREFVANALARAEAFAKELKGGACAPEGGDWTRGRRGQSRTEWV